MPGPTVTASTQWRPHIGNLVLYFGRDGKSLRHDRVAFCRLHNRAPRGRRTCTLGGVAAGQFGHHPRVAVDNLAYVVKRQTRRAREKTRRIAAARLHKKLVLNRPSETPHQRLPDRTPTWLRHRAPARAPPTSNNRPAMTVAKSRLLGKVGTAGKPVHGIVMGKSCGVIRKIVRHKR